MRQYRFQVFVLNMLAALVVISAWPGPQVAFALDPQKDIIKYSIDVWQDKDGLPRNTILAITQTRDGYLWLGTASGLARFDGARFTVFNNLNTPALKSHDITSLHESRDGSLWIGTRGGGLVRLRQSRFTSYSEENGLANNFVRVICEDREGHLWIGTNNGLSRFRDGHFINYFIRDGLPSKVVRAMCEDRAGYLWIGTGNGLARWKDGKFDLYSARQGLVNSAVRAILEDHQGRIWVGTSGGGLSLLKHGKFEVYNEKDGFSSHLIRALYEDRDGNLWIGTDNSGLYRYRNGKSSVFIADHSSSVNFVRSIYEDREGSLWVGFEGGGLTRLKNGKVTNITAKDGLSSEFTRTIRQDTAGNVWIGTEGSGLNRWRDGKITVYQAPERLSDNFIKALCEDNKGDLWVGTEDGGLNRLRRGRRIAFPQQALLSTTTIWVIYQDRAENLWVGSDRGLYRINGGNHTRYTTRDGLPNDFVRALHEDRAGDLWIGFRGHGLARYKDGRFFLYTAEDGLPQSEIFSFHEDLEGILWIATSGGLIRLKDKVFTNYTTRAGLFTDSVYQIIEDGAGRLWLSSGNGIFYVSKRELDEVAGGSRSAVTSVIYSTADGMRSSECSMGAQPGGWRTRDGKLWFPTTKGVVIIDPNNIPQNALPPPVLVERLVVDRRDLNPEARMRLPAGVKEIEFHYTGLSFLAPERVKFKYKLEGLDNNWVEAGTRRSAYYTNLAPGNYRFLVSASNNDGVWNETGAELRFNLEPRFHQTYLFYALCLIVLALAIWGAHLLRVNQMRARFTAVIDERARIAREIHDSLAQGFAGISIQLEAGKEMLFVSPAIAEEHLDQANLLARNCLEEVREYVWDLRHQIEGGDLASVLASMARKLSTGLPLDFKVLGNLRHASDFVESNILRVGQEAIINVVKHAKARRIQVELNYGSESLRLCVRDDGHGFDTRQDHVAGGHFGLLGMEERARSIGGRLKVHSSPGEGTEIVLEVPYKNEPRPPDVEDH